MHQVLGRIEPHAAGTLHDRLDDNGGNLPVMLGQQVGDGDHFAVRTGLAEATAGAGAK